MSARVAQPPSAAATQTSSTPRCASVRTLFGENDKMGAAVALPARFFVLAAERQLFSVTDRGESVGRRPQRDQVIFRRAGALGAESQVVFHRAAFIAVAFDL